MQWMILPLKRYADFSGRSRRKEYWMFFLLITILFVVAAIIDTRLGYGTTSREVTPYGASVNWSTNNGPAEWLLLLVTLVPGVAVAVRRLHDLDKSGWWVLVSFIPFAGWFVMLVWACTNGMRGGNRFGADPKGDASDLTETFR